MLLPDQKQQNIPSFAMIGIEDTASTNNPAASVKIAMKLGVIN